MVIHIKQLQSPIGPMYAGASPQGICFLDFRNEVRSAAELSKLCKELDATVETGENNHLRQLELELKEYFEKKRTGFTVPLHLSGTDFQKSAWKILHEIPYGKTWTYKQQAMRLGKLSAIRAVAASNGQNKHAILIPCHRVLGGNGSLTGYAGGLAKKDWLLKFERDKVGQTIEMDFG